jgi:hypothetical protein
MASTISVIDLRIAILRYWRRPLYHLAAEINVHPATLSGMLRDRLPMPVAVKHRILLILSRNEGQRHGR